MEFVGDLLNRLSYSLLLLRSELQQKGRVLTGPLDHQDFSSFYTYIIIVNYSLEQDMMQCLIFSAGERRETESLTRLLCGRHVDFTNPAAFDEVESTLQIVNEQFGNDTDNAFQQEEQGMREPFTTRKLRYCYLELP